MREDNPRNTLTNMPCAWMVYNAVSTNESIEFEIPTDISKMDYQIWQDACLDKNLVKFDLCSEFYHLSLMGGLQDT
jgi:hypothetical protein